MKAKQIELLAPVELQVLAELLNRAQFQGAQAPIVMSLLTKLSRAKDVEVELKDEKKDETLSSEE